MSDKSHDPNQMTGAAMIVRALIDHGVTDIFGYPGGAVLPIYDEIFQQSEVQHILVRHEQGAGATPPKAMRVRPASRASRW
ncbi:glyoxylate carboligase [Bradyrhizobium sp. LB7.1]